MSATTAKPAPLGEAGTASCAHTATLANAIACDAASLSEVLSDLIGQHLGGNSANTDVLAGMCITLARMGAMSDAIAAGHGGMPARGDLVAWMFPIPADQCAMRALAMTRAPEPKRQRKPR